MDPRISHAFKINQGSLTVHDYMALCNQIYYSTCQPFGCEGDFITAPLLSPLFGEIIGVTLLEAWYRLGAPSSFDLIELGPGQGHLMEDILRITKNHSSFHQAMTVKYVDINPHFHAPFSHKTYKTVSQVLKDQNQPLFVIANEFFDALPVHQYVSDGQERHVILQDKKLRFSHNTEDDLSETSSEIPKIYNLFAKNIQKHGGAALIIDYGYNIETPKGSTLQSVKSHTYGHALDQPGSQDLTVHVNFHPLIKNAVALKISHHFQTQRQFLLTHGIMQRAHQVMATHRLKDPKRYISGFHRLIDKDAMGLLFKTLWIESPC